MTGDAEVVELPIHLKWSGPRAYDTGDPRQLRRLHEIVLREGRATDVRRYIDPAIVAELLPDLVLPDGVRRAWSEWLSGVGRPPAC